MSSSTVFTKSVLKAKKQNKAKLLFLVLGKIIKNNPLLFFFCSLLAVITAIINYNIGINFRDAFIMEEKTLTSHAIQEIEKSKGKKIKVAEIKRILTDNYKKTSQQQKEVKKDIEDKIVGKEELDKKQATEIIAEAGKNTQTRIFDKDFKFEINFCSWRPIKKTDLRIGEFIIHVLLLIFVAKSFFSLLHYYIMAYAYDSIERDLKKDLFRHFIRAKYSNSSGVARNLITQFASDLDNIAYSIWFIPNRLIYVGTAITFHVVFDFKLGTNQRNWEFIGILFGLFVILIIVEIILFRQAAKLSIEAKKRYEEDNKIIYERINNLEHIKAVSGEKYEEEKIDRQLDSTFRKNKKQRWYGMLFKAFPNYVIIPNIPITFVALVLTLSWKSEDNPAFLMVNFTRYYFVATKLNSEVNKIIDSLLTLDELSGNLTIVNESAKTLNWETTPLLPTTKTQNLSFVNGDLTFQEVVFAYPKRPHQDILRNFSFRFVKGKIYGIAGKNGIGKSTITKTTLKLYDLKAGKIMVGERNVQEIDTASLHQRVCYQTNRPTFFCLSIAENVCYPNSYNQKDYERLVQAAKKTGIYEFIMKLPRGFDTILREGGSDLSEGQKQQISAMKMFINDYDIYILDEILSNVHPDLKEIILQNVFARLHGKTVLVIDHHYTIFKYVDYIYQFTGEKLIRMNKKEFLGN